MAHKILIVDDDKDVVEMLTKRLGQEGYTTAGAFDGEDALSKIKQENPDIVLLDLIMPKLNGFDVLKRIRSDFNDKWRPVIIISAKTELDSIKSCYAFEADHYLTKPCPMDLILQGIQTMISLIPLRK